MSNILERLRAEKKENFKGGLYHATQIQLAYNSNRIEGSRLTEEQTRYMYETKPVLPVDGSTATPINDIIETQNHFRLFNYMLQTSDKPLTEELIKTSHRILKSGTLDAEKVWFAVGDYKKIPNEVGTIQTTPPGKVSAHMRKLLSDYAACTTVRLEDLVQFHYEFERIHPFQDGNGRIGRIILFKEALKNDITPFIVEDVKKAFYYRGLQEYPREPGYLLDTCLDAQDHYAAMAERYATIPYERQPQEYEEEME